jgi:hypothetical protein
MQGTVQKRQIGDRGGGKRTEANRSGKRKVLSQLQRIDCNNVRQPCLLVVIKKTLAYSFLHIGISTIASEEYPIETTTTYVCSKESP